MGIAPQLDEEESESIMIPAAYRCDACAAVAYQLQAGLQAAEARRPGRQLRVAELLEAFEDAEAGLDEGLPSLCLPILVYIENPYRSTYCSDE